MSVFNGIDFPFFMDGNPNSDILVVCDPPLSAEHKAQKPLYGHKKKLLYKYLTKNGINPLNLFYISPTPEPIPEIDQDSEARKKAFLEQYRSMFVEFIKMYNPKMIVALGNLAMYQVAGKPVKITNVRGIPNNYQIKAQSRKKNPDDPEKLVLPILSAGQVLRSPDKENLYDVDFATLRAVIENNYEKLPSDKFEGCEYSYSDDISFLLDMKPKAISVDTETTGLTWYRPDVRVLTIQASWAEGKAVASIVSPAYDKSLSFRKANQIIKQWKQLLEDPSIKKVAHNFKYDDHMLKKLGIHTKNWYADTLQLAFALDENMVTKSQAECVKRWVPSMANYSLEFDEKYPKDKMIEVPKDDMLMYACGDADTCLRLAKVQLKELVKDEKQARVFNKVQMPALRAFSKVEDQGIILDLDKVRQLKTDLEVRERELYEDIMAEIKPAVKRKHLHDLSLTRPALIRDALFSPEGANLKPVVFTKSTKKLEASKQVPSVSIKDHLPYFETIPLVKNIMEYSQISKGINTYVGSEEANTGFWKHIDKDTGKIHPNFLLWGTVTGRTSSKEPNAQNFPKRGPVAESYRKIFIPKPGYTLCEVDLSQAELRIAAWMANETNMINIYKGGGDIHISTAATVMGITVEEFLQLDKKVRKRRRYEAKAVNFGLIYGMGVRKFIEYAKTQYGIDYTFKEATLIRERFFAAYPKLLTWHSKMTDVVTKLGYVRALHGAKRNLPNVYSKDDGAAAEAIRQAINSPVQRFGSDIGLMALDKISRDCPQDLIIPVAFIHDALVVYIKNDYLVEGGSAIKYVMENIPFKDTFGITPPLPIVADVSIGDNLSEMIELGEVKEADFPSLINKYSIRSSNDYFDYKEADAEYSIKAVMPDWYTGALN